MNARRSISLFVSLSLALSPLASLPAYAQNDFPDRLTSFMERAGYASLRSAQNPPTAAELNNLEKEATTIRVQLQQSFAQRLISLSQDDLDPNDLKASEEILKLIEDLNLYFGLIKSIEGAKVLMNLPVYPENYEQLYTLKIPLDKISQASFLNSLTQFTTRGASVRAQETEADQTVENGSFKTELNYVDGQWQVELSPDDSFISEYEVKRLANHSNAKNTMLFGLLSSSRLLYSSMGVTQRLLNAPIGKYPQVPKELTAFSPSLRNIRQRLTAQDRLIFYNHIKPQLFSLVVDSLSQLQKQDRGFVFEHSFLVARNSILNLSPPDKPDAKALQNMRETESKDLQTSLESILRMIDLSSQNDLPRFVITASLRLMARWTMLQPEIGKASEQQISSLEQLIDYHVGLVVQDILQNTDYVQKFKSLVKNGAVPSLVKARQDFNENLKKIAVKFANLENEPVNFAALLAAKEASLQTELNSDFMQSQVNSLKQQSSYSEAYKAYLQNLTSYLGLFKFPSPQTSENSSFANLEKIAKNAIWNPAALEGKLPPAYIQVLNAKQTKTDLTAMITLGKALKFDVYEGLKETKETPSPKDLKFDQDSWFNTLRSPEFNAYKQAYRTNLFNEIPLLSGLEEKKVVLEILANANDQEVSSIIERQLRLAETQIQTNIAQNEKFLIEVQSAPDDAKLTEMNEKFRTLMTRSSVIGSQLYRIAGFKSYYNQFTSELSSLDYWLNQMDSYSNSSNMIFLFMIAIQFAPMVGRHSAWANKVATLLPQSFMNQLNWIFWGGLAGLTGGYGYQAYREKERLNTLNQFYSCGSASLCLATQDDLDRQQALYEIQRNQILYMGAGVALLIGGIMGGSRLLKAIEARRSNIRIKELKEDLSVLGLNPNTASLNQINIRNAYEESLRKARQFSQNKNPIAGQMGEAYVHSAFNRLQRNLAREAAHWVNQDKKFTAYFETLGLSRDSWKSLENLNASYNHVTSLYNAGKITASQKAELDHVLGRMLRIIEPIYKKIDRMPLQRNYYNWVWNSTAAARMHGNQSLLAFLQNRLYYSNRYIRFMNGTYDAVPLSYTERIHRVASRLDDVMLSLAKDFDANPNNANLALQKAVNLYRPSYFNQLNEWILQQLRSMRQGGVQ